MVYAVLLTSSTRALESEDPDDADIDFDDTSPRRLGERCSDDYPCATGLDCIRAPVRRKCYPVECIHYAAQNAFAEDNFDLASYGKDMMSKRILN